MKFDNVLTDSEKERIARKKAPIEEFEGYDDTSFTDFDEDYDNQFGHDEPHEEEPELEQNTQPQKPQKEKPQFNDGIDAAAYYAGQLLRWVWLTVLGVVKIITQHLGYQKIQTFRLIFVNVLAMFIMIIGDLATTGSNFFRINLLVAAALNVFYVVLMVFRGEGGFRQLILNKDDLLEILGRGAVNRAESYQKDYSADESRQGEYEDEDEDGEDGYEDFLGGDGGFLEDGFANEDDDEIVYLGDSEESEEDDELGEFDFGEFNGDDLQFDFSATDFPSEENTEGEGEGINMGESKPTMKIELEKDGRLGRARLFDIMLELLPNKTPDYADIIEHEEGSDDFLGWEGMILKALASATKKQLEEVDSQLVYVKENSMTVFLEMTRIHGFTNTKKIQEEIEAFLIGGKADSGISVKVELAGNNYLITVLKEIRPIIFLKDAMQTPKVSSFLKNSNKVMPVVIGIDEYANPELIDMVSMESCITTGMARSGKSKSLTSKFGQMCALNTPQDVQFIIFDPKRSELLKSMSLMPHVAGIHNLETGLDALRDIVEREGEYRKKLFEKNKVNNIAGFNKRFPKNRLPYIWIIADEIMTIKEEFSSQKTKEHDPWKEFVSLLTIIFTQLPYVGIKMWGISHRVSSVLTPNLVMNLFYKESIRGSAKLVEELLGKDEAPETKLKYPGDSAVWYAGSSGKFIKSFLVCFDEEDEKKNSVPEHEQEGYFWREMAKAFYDIGFEYPERKRYGIAFNRGTDEEILEEINCEGAVPVGLDDDLDPDFELDETL